MKTLARIRSILVLACAGISLVLASCAPVEPGDARANSRPDPTAFADALSPPGGVPCRVKRPTYTVLQRQLGIGGRVEVTYIVSTVGRIDLVIIEKSSGNQDLDNAVRDAIAHGTCAPYVVDGVAHRVVQHASFTFSPTPTAKPASGGNLPPAVAASSAPSAAAAAASVYPSPQAAASPVAPLPPPAASAQSATSAPSLDQAIQAAMLQKWGIAPDSARAALIKRWGERMRDDPDVSRFFGNGPNHANVLLLSPPVRNAFFIEGVLRLSPEDRSKLTELTLTALNNAPPDCGGVKSTALIMSGNAQLATMSDADAEAFFSITFKILKQSALQTPLAQVTEEQRAQSLNALGNTLKDMLKNDVDGTRAIASAAVDPAGISAGAWCKSMRVYYQALLNTPQPYRDWAIVASNSDAKAKLGLLPQSSTPGAVPPGAPPVEDFASQVQRRVRPNIVWAGPAAGLETTISVRCAPAGTLLSATISRSSGNAAWDRAALQAVQRSDPMPVGDDGRTPRVFMITLRPAG
jgi:TonB family protein